MGEGGAVGGGGGCYKRMYRVHVVGLPRVAIACRSDCTCHNRVALGDAGGEVGAAAAGEAGLHVVQAGVQGRK